MGLYPEGNKRMDEEEFKDLLTDSERENAEQSEEPNVEQSEENTEESYETKKSSEKESEEISSNEEEPKKQEEKHDELPKGVIKRFSKLSKRARDAERRNLELEKRIEAMERLQKQMFPNKKESEEPLTRERVEELVSERLKIREQERIEREADEKFEAAEDDARVRFDDYDDCASYASANVEVSHECNLYLKNSPYGARILYTIGKFPKVMEAVNESVKHRGLESSLSMIKSIEARIIEIDSKLKSKNPTENTSSKKETIKEEPKQTVVRSPKKTQGSFKLKLDPSKCSDKEWMEADD